METRIQIVAIAITAALFLGVLELVRRRRLMERYALLWLGSSAILLALSIWKGLLEDIAHAIGIFYAPSALFVIAFGFILILLLHFSLVISRLADQSKVLAQRIGLLQEELERVREPAAPIDELELPDAAEAAVPRGRFGTARELSRRP